MGFGGFLAGIGTGIGLGLDVIGRARAAREAERAAEDKARLAEAEAGRARERTRLELDRRRRGARRDTGEERAGFAAAGVRLSGSALDLLADGAAEAAADERLIALGGDGRTARALAEARAFRRRGRSAARDGMIDIGTTLLSGGYDFFRSRDREGKSS